MSSNTLTASTYWDDQTAISSLSSAIGKAKGQKFNDNATGVVNFYKDIVQSGNHKHVSEYNKLQNRTVLAAYDGDKIEGSENNDLSKSIRDLNEHAYMTRQDLSGKTTAFSRSSFLSAGMTSKNIALVEGAIGFSSKDKEYFSDSSTTGN